MKRKLIFLLALAAALCLSLMPVSSWAEDSDSYSDNSGTFGGSKLAIVIINPPINNVVLAINILSFVSNFFFFEIIYIMYITNNNVIVINIFDLNIPL